MTHCPAADKCRRWIAYLVIAFWGISMMALSPSGFAADEDTRRDIRALFLNPWSKPETESDVAIDPPTSARHAEAVRQMTSLATEAPTLDFYWADIRPQQLEIEGETNHPSRSVRGEVALRYNLTNGAVEDRRVGYNWTRRNGWVGGGNWQERREQWKRILLDLHPLFKARDGVQNNPPLNRTGVLAFSNTQQPFLESLEFAMGVPGGWEPIVKDFFAKRKTLAGASSAELLEGLKAARTQSASDSVLTQVYALRRLHDMPLSPAEKAALSNLTVTDDDSIMCSLWLSQWMIALYEHENPMDLGKRLDAMANAELAKDETVNRAVFVMLVASMASHLHFVDTIDVPFALPKENDEGAASFFVARAEHIRGAVSELPKDKLSDWGRSIANYPFTAPYATVPAATTTESSPKE